MKREESEQQSIRAKSKLTVIAVPVVIEVPIISTLVDTFWPANYSICIVGQSDEVIITKLRTNKSSIATQTPLAKIAIKMQRREDKSE